jgi:uncharacterized protein YneF (UPF0154 family)
MNLTAKKSIIVLTGSLLLAAILDRAVIAREIPFASNVLLVKPGVVLFGVPFLPDTTFGVLSLVVIPLAALAIFLLPLKSPRDGSAWRGAWNAWRRVAIAILLIPVFILVGGFLYSLVKEYLPDPVAALAEAFGFKPSFYIGSQDTLLVGPLDGSVACLIGLVGGIWCAQKWLEKQGS